MKFFHLLFAGLLILSCGVKKNVVNTEKNKDTQTTNAIKIDAVIGEFAKQSDPITTIDTVFIEGNIMYIDLTYGGGCKEHQFEVIGSFAIAKSYPPIRSLQIVHNANNDMCRALVSVRLAVNIENVAYKQEAGSEIYYTLEGWNERIYHKYVN